MSPTAQDLMTKRFLRISTEHTLREALALLLYGEAQKAETAAIVVIDTEGEFAGILTPECVVKGLSGGHEEQPSLTGIDALLERMERCFPETIDSVMKTDIPTISKDTPLAALIPQISHDKRECLPVKEEGHIVGLVYASDIFKATAAHALIPGMEGIHLDA